MADGRVSPKISSNSCRTRSPDSAAMVARASGNWFRVSRANFKIQALLVAHRAKNAGGIVLQALQVQDAYLAGQQVVLTLVRVEHFAKQVTVHADGHGVDR